MQGNGAAAAAQTSRVVTVGSKKFELGKLTFKDFATAKEQCAAEYKRSMLATYIDNPDYIKSLPPEIQATVIQDAFARAEKITADSLPSKMAWLPKRDQNGKLLLNRGERFFHKESKQWIETGGPLLEEQEIEYSGWWMSQTNMGKIFATWLSMRKCKGQEHLTVDDVAELLQDDELLEQTANAVGELSQQKLGNSQPPAETVAGAVAT